MHSKSWSGFMLGSQRVSHLEGEREEEEEQEDGGDRKEEEVEEQEAPHMPMSCSSQVPPATKSTGSVMQPIRS